MKKFNKDKLIEEVVKMRIKDLASTATILDYIMKEADVKQAQAYNYLSEAQDIISEMYKDIRKAALEEAIAQTQTLLEQAETVVDKLKVRQELSKLQGLYVDRIEHSGEIVIKTEWNDGNENNSTI
jgi:uncharacterized protein YggE